MQGSGDTSSEGTLPIDHGFAMEPAWRAVLTDLGVDEKALLRRADLPADLFSEEGRRISVDAHFRFWTALEAVAQDPLLPLTLSRLMTRGQFSAPLFAATCAANLTDAFERLRTYKRLIAPMRLSVETTATDTWVSCRWIDEKVVPPTLWVGTELTAFLAIVRWATRHHVVPTRVISAIPLTPAGPYLDFFGVTLEVGAHNAVCFSAEDARRPFLTENASMWALFEPELRRRLDHLDQSSTVKAQVQAALMEALPGGDVSRASVARRLAMSERSLSRRLKEEGTRFRVLLAATRESLARRYLGQTALRPAEIAFLLGYDDTNSFYRAFKGWTGATPERVRAGVS